MITARLQLRRLHAGSGADAHDASSDGRIVLPDGMSYRVLVLPDVETMTPALLGQDQGVGRGRGDGGRPVAAAEVAEPDRLSPLRCRGADAGREALWASAASGHRHDGPAVAGRAGRAAGLPGRPAAALYPPPPAGRRRVLRRQRRPGELPDRMQLPRHRQTAGTLASGNRSHHAAGRLRRETGLHARAAPLRAGRVRVCRLPARRGPTGRARGLRHARRPGIAGRGPARAALRRRPARLRPAAQEVSQPAAMSSEPPPGAAAKSP